MIKKTSGRLSRRGFLRLSLTTAMGAAVAACETAPPQPSPVERSTTPLPTIPPAITAAPSPTPTSTPRGRITINTSAADAWAWEYPVKASVENLDCESLQFQVNGLEMEGEREGVTYSANIPLSSGINRVVAVCRLKGGSEESSNMIDVTGRLRSIPTARIQLSLDGDVLHLDGSASVPAPGSDTQTAMSPIVRHTWSAGTDNPAPVVLKGVHGLSDREFRGEASGPSVSVQLPDVPGDYFFTLSVMDEAGRADRSRIYVEVRNGQARIPDFEKENPAWVEQAIVYGVIPRLFGSRGFIAITEKLDYLAELGITALWLAPVNVSPEGDYGYAVKDYFGLNPQHGTKEEFYRMVQEAHARDIRILMDFVPNHTSVEHPYYQDTLANGQASPYYDFYDRDVDGQVTHYFNWEHLPNLNYNNPQVTQWMLEAFSYWVREFDVDGFRVDVAWGIRERKPEFWPVWRRELKRIKPDLLLLAEASARDPYYFDNGYDAAYDWTDALGRWAWELVWERQSRELLIYNLNTALTNNRKGFHPDALIFRFLNNNDTGARFITTHGPELNRVATAMLLTLPGIPCVYTGDEAGEAFRPYHDSAPLAWKEQVPGLLNYHKKLIELRKNNPSLFSRLWEIAELEPHTQVYGYIRYHGENEDPFLVLLNFFEEDAEVEVQLPEAFTGMAHGGRLQDVLNDELISVAGSNPIKILVPGYTARILTGG